MSLGNVTPAYLGMIDTIVRRWLDGDISYQQADTELDDIKEAIPEPTYQAWKKRFNPYG